ncbi:MAG: hypothetical protein ACFFBH_16980, partial [Promethearchaeota archaeon]
MNNKVKIKIIALGTIFLLVIINCYVFFNFCGGYTAKTASGHDNLNDLKNSANLAFIDIDNNWSLTASTYDWCTGNGSWNNPYIIDSVTIDASTSPTGSGIVVNNSKTDYFRIENC